MCYRPPPLNMQYTSTLEFPELRAHYLGTLKVLLSDPDGTNSGLDKGKVDIGHVIN